MTHIRIRGFQIFKDRHKNLRCYHRASKIAVDLKTFPLGSAEFMGECARIAALCVRQSPKPGTLGLLVREYKKSPAWQELRPKTQEFYEAPLEYLKPINDTSLTKFDTPLVIRIRDKAQEKRGWYFANQLKSTLSVLFSWGRERGYMANNPAKQVKKIKRPKDKPRANRPWNADERAAIMLTAAHIRPVLAAMLYTGIDPCDAVSMPKTMYKDGAFNLSRQKTGNVVWKPAPKILKAVISSMPKHGAITLFANSYGKPWTKSGLDSVWAKERKQLENRGEVGKGLTLKGLRHTHATMLREQGENDRTIADALGDKSESMGRWYSRDADNKFNMQKVINAFDKRNKVVKPSKKNVKP